MASPLALVPDDSQDERGLANGVRCERIGPERLHELEPHAAGVAALHVPETGIVNYRAVCERLGQRVREADGTTIFREQLGDIAYEIAFATSPRFHPPDLSITVPPDQFFVMRDNRFNARDSRCFGPITFSSIIGKKL